ALTTHSQQIPATGPRAIPPPPVPPPPPSPRVGPARRVRHPLQALRGYIRRYVTLEGAAVAVMYLSLWFWIGLALDYGLFALFRFDWIKELDRAAGETGSLWVRGGLLFGLGAGGPARVAFYVLRRPLRAVRGSGGRSRRGPWARAPNPPSPRELATRLITAVEMADPKLSEKYGYSQIMLDRTIREAAERVEKLPVHEVFNWARLRWQLAWA